MYRESATNLLDLKEVEIADWLKTFDVLFTDCDGVLNHDEKAIEGSAAVVNRLQAMGKRVYFVTNNSIKTRQELWQRYIRLGFNIEEAQIIAPNHTIANYLTQRKFKQKAYIVGNAAMARELRARGIQSLGCGPDILDTKLNEYIKRELHPTPALQVPLEERVGAVIVTFDENFTFCKMLKASHYLSINPECLFIATNCDTVHRYPNFCIPGTGAILKSIETCVGREAMLMGKPSPDILSSILSSGEIKPERCVMVGDCCKVDVPFGKNCGFQTLLVGTGLYDIEAILEMLGEKSPEKQKYIPDLYLPKLGDLLPYL